MRLVGRLHDWNDARGFGFVTPNGGGERAFVHVRAFESRARRPVDGDLLSYTTVTDARGRPNAASVRFAGASAPPARETTTRRRRPFRATGLALAFAIALVALVVLGLLPWIVAAAYVAMSAITYFAYLADKSAALRGRRRTPESTLHLMALLGGWPGAAFAQQHFEHKRSKAVFVDTFRATVVANIVLLVAGIVLRAHPQWWPR
jgi:uncharacterized membrane protein YsdA (DUF1294 family)/cold shock CspA family protein